MLDRRLLPVIATALPVIAVALWSHVFLPSTAWAGGFEWFVTAGLSTAALATAVATWGRIRWLGIAIPAVLLTANTAFVIGTLFGVNPIPTQGFSSDKYAVVLSAGTLLGVVGLVLRRQWARWLGLALGAAGIGCGTLNAIHAWPETTAALGLPWHAELCRVEWVHLVTALGGAVIVLNLVATRASFVASAAWSRPDPLMRWLRLSLIASFVAVPMLLVYAWMQPLVPATQPTALVLAVALTVSAVLAVRGKLVGALLLAVAGCGLLAQTIATALLAETPSLAVYYAVFWTPAAVIALVTGCLLVRPTLRVLRG